jgi:BirA family transcriptional regulator, biotin operon repressor / biotin---[acetyl-CoA-carboxylase] ligase
MKRKVWRKRAYPKGLWFWPIPLLALASSVAVAKAIEETLGLRCYLKWPNDIFVKIGGNLRKVCGFLVEMSAEPDKIKWVILGIGIDVNNTLPAPLKKIAGTLSQAAKKNLDRTLILQNVLLALEETYQTIQTKGFAALKADYQKRSIIAKGNIVSLTDPSAKVRGKFSHFADDGSIVLTIRGEKRNFFAGDVKIN